MSEVPALQLTGVGKVFGGTVALDAVDLTVRAGEIHGLAGENGAGKSTLIKILCGATKPDAGEMSLFGRPYRPGTPADGLRAGIRVVHQELQMLDEMSVAENILFEHLPRTKLGTIDRALMDARARALLSKVGLPDMSPRRKVATLGMAHRQLIEIARALSGESRIVILDEPTATLTPKETDQLLRILRQLRDEGAGVIFVTHHLQEIFECCDRVSVLRNGRHVATQPIPDTSPDDLVAMMVGKSLSQPTRPQNAAPARPAGAIPALEVRDFSSSSPISAAPKSLRVDYGEILGIAGLVGSGRTELLRAIAGAEPAASGQIFLDGREVQIRHPADAIRKGICLLTEDRKDEGLILEMSIAANVSLASLSKVSRLGIVQAGAERSMAQSKVTALAIRCRDPQQSAGKLSGGNQQKVVLAKWLERNPKVLLLDEPTRGVDVGAKAEIHELLRRFAAEGKAVVAVSSDLRELIEVCDRIVVMSKGAIAGEMERSAFDEEGILKMAYSEYLRPDTREAVPA